MTKRPTVTDLAKAAGVGVATVDRVLNGRLPVREETARRVYEAAERLGYHAAGVIRRRIERELPQVKLGFILQRPNQEFYRSLRSEIEAAVAAATRFRASARFEFLESQTPTEVSSKLRSVGAACDAVAVVSVDHPTITSAVQELKAAGVPVFALLSDFAADARLAYLGVDNRKSGRTAAWMIARSAPQGGKVALIIGSHRFHGHELREIGFRSYFREFAPHFEPIDTLVNLEASSLAHEATLDLLKRYPDLVGLYVAGGGMEGVIAALREEKMAGRLTAVCSELTTTSRNALLDGIMSMTLCTPLPSLARELVSLMAQSVLGGTAEIPAQLFLPFVINVAENI